MKATASNRIGAGRPVNASVTSDLAMARLRDIVPDRRAANADDFRPKFRQVVEAAGSRIERALVSVAQGLRDGPERRQTVRELRLLGRSRLADIGIEPDDIERVVDGMVAARRRRTENGGRPSQPRPE